jgi:hypothetical protein
MNRDLMTDRLLELSCCINRFVPYPNAGVVGRLADAINDKEAYTDAELGFVIEDVELYLDMLRDTGEYDVD